MRAPDSTLAPNTVWENSKWLLSGLYCFVIVLRPYHVFSMCKEAFFLQVDINSSTEILIGCHLLSIFMARAAHLSVWQMCTTQ